MTAAHLLPLIHSQAGAGHSKLDQEDNEQNDHVLQKSPLR